MGVVGDLRMGRRPSSKLGAGTSNDSAFLGHVTRLHTPRRLLVPFPATIKSAPISAFGVVRFYLFDGARRFTSSDQWSTKFSSLTRSSGLLLGLQHDEVLAI